MSEERYTYRVVFTADSEDAVADWLYGIEDEVDRRFPDFGPNAGMEAKMHELGFRIEESRLEDSEGNEV